jgi:arabinose-5-phosphate isomerase
MSGRAVPGPETLPETLVAWAREALAREAQALTHAASRVGPAFAGAVQAILAARGKVLVTGLGKSGHVARKVASTLSSTGTSAFFLHPSEALHGDFGMMQPADCLIAIAFGGETAEVLEVGRFARRIGVPVVAITGKAGSTLAQLAHFVLDGGVDREADPLNLAPTCSSTVAIALGDALAVTLMRARGFTHTDFASLHPGGSLGRRLSRVQDHMHAEAVLPRVQMTADFHAVLESVTNHNFGITAVVDAQGDLVGAISDGDLRRALLQRGAQALTCTARDLMSPNPTTISPETLAIDAVALMNDRPRPITSLFVTAEGGGRRPLGLLRLHDLLAAKIL